jgi:hypothetical protein
VRTAQNLSQHWKDWILIFKVKLFPDIVDAHNRLLFFLALLRSLITRHYGSRPNPEALPTHPFFSSLPISTLNFLDRSNFTAKTREEKISFMKGLEGVLGKFSEGLRTRKILPSLLEEVSCPISPSFFSQWIPLTNRR